MNKDKMIDIVKKNLRNSVSGASFYTYGNIPKEKFNNAKMAYANANVSYENVIGLTDETVFGSAKRGFLFTFDGFYYDGCKEMKRYSTTFNSISSFYNLSSFNNMLKQLNDAYNEGSGFWGSVLNFAGEMLGEYVNSKIDEQEKLKEQQDEKDTQETISNIENIREKIAHTSQSICAKVLSYEKGEIDYVKLREFMIEYAGIFSGDTDFIKKYSQRDELAQEISNNSIDWDSIENMLMNMNEDTDEDRIHIRRAMNRFKSTILKIADVKTNKSQEECFDIIKEAVERLEKVFDSIIDGLDCMVDAIYDEMEE